MPCSLSPYSLVWSATELAGLCASCSNYNRHIWVKIQMEFRAGIMLQQIESPATPASYRGMVPMPAALLWVPLQLIHLGKLIHLEKQQKMLQIFGTRKGFQAPGFDLTQPQLGPFRYKLVDGRSFSSFFFSPCLCLAFSLSLTFSFSVSLSLLLCNSAFQIRYLFLKSQNGEFWWVCVVWQQGRTLLVMATVAEIPVTRPW